MLSDSQLLRCFAEERSQEAFAGLVERHVGLVYGVAMRVLSGDAHRAQEVAQTVFANLAKQARVLMHHEALVGWLHVSAHNAAVSIIRSEQRRKVREQEAHSIMQTGVTGEQQTADWSQLGPVLDEAMSRMGEADRAALLLRYFHNRSYAEIGAEFDLSADASRKRTERALEKLRGLLARRGVTSTAAALGLAMANQALTAAPAGLAASVTSATFATAAVATAGAGGMTLIQFMSIAKMKAGIIGAVVVASAATVGSATLVNSALEQRREQSRLRSEMDEALGKKRLTELQKALADAESAKTAAQKAHDEAKAKLARDSAQSNDSFEKLRLFQEIVVRSQLSKEYRPFMLEINRLNGVKLFGPLFDKLQLTPEQRKQFLDAHVELIDVNLNAQAGEAWDKQRSESVIQRYKAILGEEGYKFYKEGTFRTADMGESLSLDLADAGVPVSTIQRDSLTRALGEISLQLKSPSEQAKNPISIGKVMAGLRQVLPPLTEAQQRHLVTSYFAELEKEQLKKQYQAQWNARMAAERKSASGSGRK